MGNANGSSSDRLAVAALSQVISSKRPELMSLRASLTLAASKHEGSTPKVKCLRKDLESAIKACNIEENDAEIFGKMFTLFDKTGGGKVDYRELLCGFSPLVNETLHDRLLLAFELVDEQGKGFVTKIEMRFILSSMNNTCNFLSDPTLDVDQIDELFESLFISTQDSGDGAESFGYFDNINLLAEHPIFDAFLRSAELPER